MRKFGDNGVGVKVVGTTQMTVVHALLSDDLRHAALCGKQIGLIITIRIVPNLDCEAKLGWCRVWCGVWRLRDLK